MNDFCIFEDKPLECSLLISGFCPREKCSFQRTGEQFAESLEKSNKRLRTLSVDDQIYIAGKYFGGKMPWHPGKRIERRPNENQSSRGPVQSK